MTCLMALSAELRQNFKPFSDNGDVFISVKNHRVGRKITLICFHFYVKLANNQLLINASSMEKNKILKV